MTDLPVRWGMGDFKGNVQFAQKVTFEPLMDFKQQLLEVGNITKAANFKSFLHQSYKNTKLFFMTVLLNIFMRKKSTNDFWGLHKNMNCVFPLRNERDPSNEGMILKWGVDTPLQTMSDFE